MTTINYDTWFSVKFTHEFFNHAEDTIADLSLEPGADSIQSFFTGTNWLQRFIGDTLYVLTKQAADGKPALPVPAEKFFRFYLTCNNYLFFNYTDIDTRIGKGYILYFSNFANNEISSVLNLSVPVTAYTSYPAGTTFYPGDLVADSAGNIYECIVQATNKALTLTAFWLKRSNKQCVSGADVLRVSPANYQHSFTDGIKSVTATVKGFKVSGNVLATYDAVVINKAFPQPVNNVQVDLSLLQPGRYRIVFSAIKASDNSTINYQEDVYYDSVINFKKALGVVEIFNCLQSTDHYSQTDNTGVMKGSNNFQYIIAFASRMAWWNYIAKTTVVTGINSSIPGVSFAQDATDHKLFVSNAPLPFVKRFDYTALTVAGPTPSQTISFPSPSILKSETDAGGSIVKVFTEVYLNY